MGKLRWFATHPSINRLTNPNLNAHVDRTSVPYRYIPFTRWSWLDGLDEPARCLLDVCSMLVRCLLDVCLIV